MHSTENAEPDKVDHIRKLYITKNILDNEIRAISILIQQHADTNISSEILSLGCRILKPEHFFNSYNQHVFKIIRSAAECKKEVMPLELILEAIADNDWDNINKNEPLTKKAYLFNCRQQRIVFELQFLGIPPLTFAKSMFHVIIDQYLRITSVDLLNNLTKNLSNTANPIFPQDQLLALGAKVQQLLIKNTYGSARITDYNTRILNSLNYKAPPLIFSKFKKLDEIINGFSPGQLVTIGASPGVGKTAFALNLALNFCEQGQKVAFWCFEMSELELDRRIFAIRTGCLPDTKENNYSEEHYNLIRNYHDYNLKKKYPDDIHLYTNKINNFEDFLLYCRTLKLNNERNIVVIDYIQMISDPSISTTNRVQEIEHITRNLKSLALELNLLIIIISQLSRKVNERSNNTPILSDLRESGSIEQDSNLVIFLSNSKDACSFNLSERMINLTVAKNRNGRIGQCNLRYIGSKFKFTD